MFSSKSIYEAISIYLAHSAQDQQIICTSRMVARPMLLWELIKSPKDYGTLRWIGVHTTKGTDEVKEILETESHLKGRKKWTKWQVRGELQVLCGFEYLVLYILGKGMCKSFKSLVR